MEHYACDEYEVRMHILKKPMLIEIPTSQKYSIDLKTYLEM